MSLPAISSYASWLWSRNKAVSEQQGAAADNGGEKEWGSGDRVVLLLCVYIVAQQTEILEIAMQSIGVPVEVNC